MARFNETNERDRKLMYYIRCTLGRKIKFEYEETCTLAGGYIYIYSKKCDGVFSLQYESRSSRCNREN